VKKGLPWIVSKAMPCVVRQGVPRVRGAAPDLTHHRWGGLFLSAASALVLPLALFGCGDLETEPSVAYLSSEPVAALRFAADLPGVPPLVARWDRSGALVSVSEAWQASWDQPGAEGQRIRHEARAAVSLALSTTIPEAAVRNLVRAVDEAVRGASALLGVDLPTGGPLQTPLSEAAVARDEARLALDAGEMARALEAALLAADRLRETSAGSVARLLVAEAEAELRRISASSSYAEENRARALRLVEGAREALRDGDDVLALRRSWYALGLLAPDRNEHSMLAPNLDPQERP